MIVPFLNLAASYNEISDELESAILKSTRSGQYIGGQEVEHFEEEFAEFVDAEYCVAVGNGLDALVLSLMAANITAGDEVIVPSHTFIATWLAVSRVGAKIVPVEVDPSTRNIDPEKVIESITENTKAIIPVHLYGHPANLDKLTDIAKQFNLSVIEDAAQAHGACYHGKKIGSHSESVCWSFYPGKNLGALGDGGAVTTNDPRIAELLRLFRNYGSSERYVHDVLGVNTRLDPVQAAVLRVKLKYLEDWNQRRRIVAQTYLDQLSELSIQLPQTTDQVEHAWHLFCIQAKGRDKLRAALYDNGVETLIHYPVPPYRQEAYLHLGFKKSDFPVTDKISSSLLSLPICPSMTERQIEFVVKTMNKLVTY